MDQAQIEVHLLKNTDDIGKVVAITAELATMMKYEVERGKEDRSNLKDAVGKMTEISEKMSVMTAVQQQVTQITAQQAQYAQDIVNVKDTVGLLLGSKEKFDDHVKEYIEVKTTVAELKTHREKYNLGEMGGRLLALEQDKLKKDGASGMVRLVIHGFWAVFGTAFLTFSAWAIGKYFDDSRTSKASYTYEGKGVISGE